MRDHDVSLYYISPTDRTCQIDEAPRDRLLRALQIRVAPETWVPIQDHTEALRNLLQLFLAHEQLKDRAFGLPGEFSVEDGVWVSGSLVRDPRRVIVDTLHILLRISEHLVQLLCDERLSDGKKTKKEQVHAMNKFAEKMKITVKCHEDAVGPVSISCKSEGKAVMEVSLNGEMDKKLFTSDQAEDNIRALVKEVFVAGAVADNPNAGTRQSSEAEWVQMFSGFGKLMRPLLSMTTVWTDETIVNWQREVVDPWGDLVSQRVDKGRITQYMRLLDSKRCQPL